MDIYVLDNARSKDFIALCETIKINPNKTCDDFIHNGFTNYYEPVLHFYRKINYPDNYDVSFSIDIDKKTMEIKEISILDENFCQPHFCDDIAYNQVSKMIDSLVEKELFYRRAV